MCPSAFSSACKDWVSVACVGVFGRGVDVAVGGVEIGPHAQSTERRRVAINVRIGYPF